MMKDEGQMFNLLSTFLIMGEYKLLPTLLLLFLWKDACECNRAQFWQDVIILDKLSNFWQEMNAQNYTPSQLAKKEQVLWVCSVFNSVLQFCF